MNTHTRFTKSFNVVLTPKMYVTFNAGKGNKTEIIQFVYEYLYSNVLC